MFYVPVTRHIARPSASLVHSIDRLLAASAADEGETTLSPALDLVETDAAYAVTLNLPGVRKEDVRVSVDGRVVSVQAQAPAELEKKDGERVLVRERAAARYARQFKLPQEVDQSEVRAVLEHGVLNLTLPKRAARTASQITIN